MKTLTLSALAVCLALPAAADRIVIDDDGWFVVPDTPTARAIDIDDDGWSYVTPDVVSTRATVATPGDCTQLERSIGLRGESCGILTPAQLAEIHAD